MQQTKLAAQSRIASIDIMRGLVILLMMLDHVRERFFMHTRTGDPIYDTVDPGLFFTRFATHFCAPVLNAFANYNVVNLQNAAANKIGPHNDYN